MQQDFAVSGLWQGDFDDAGMRDWAIDLRAQLRAPRVSLGLVFMTPKYFPAAAQILELIRVHGQVPLLLGCSSTGLIVGGREWEDKPGVALSLFSLPGAQLRGLRFTQEQVEESNGPGYWHIETGLDASQVNGWLAFADPFHLDAEAVLRAWNQAYKARPILGGLASGNLTEQTTQVYLNGDVFQEGGVALAVAGAVEMVSVISQGCTPIGETWTITKAEGNFVHQIANRPAYEVLAETFGKLSAQEQLQARGNLFIGLVVNEYMEDFHQGDFLVRNILGADPHSGSLAVGAWPRQGQTLQFQRRDAAAADLDMKLLLDRLAEQLGKRRVYGGCLCSCNGRGHRLFGQMDHDASLVQARIGPVELTGFFCNGELGPVGDRNFLHSYTASLALFAEKG
ncbi:MAG: FIST N-terminal domain-containing protein [Verrucomicrobiota bacterium]|jgi:small ligand-binding sensory domain FIST